MTSHKFVSAYSVLQASLLSELGTLAAMDPARHTYLSTLMDYTCQGGKMIRGKLVCDIADRMTPLRDMKIQEHDVAIVAAACGWGVEFMQAHFLIEDDIMDRSITRRDQPCWYNLPGVGFQKGINDGLIVQCWMDRMLQQNVSSHPEYVRIIHMFNETQYLTSLGQFYDVTSAVVPCPRVKPKKKLDLSQFTSANYRRIVQYKTTHYTVQLPLALGLAVTGTTSLVKDADLRELSRIIGEYFQSQDDFLDCYGDPKVIGKIGTDIQEGKCSWLAAAFLETADAKQKVIFEKHYAKSRKANVTTIKSMYRDARLEERFKTYEDRVGAEVEQRIKALDCRPFADGVQSLWDRLYQRKK